MNVHELCRIYLNNVNEFLIAIEVSADIRKKIRLRTVKRNRKISAIVASATLRKTITRDTWCFVRKT